MDWSRFSCLDGHTSYAWILESIRRRWQTYGVGIPFFNFLIKFCFYHIKDLHEHSWIPNVSTHPSFFLTKGADDVVTCKKYIYHVLSFSVAWMALTPPLWLLLYFIFLLVLSSFFFMGVHNLIKIWNMLSSIQTSSYTLQTPLLSCTAF